MLNVIHLVEIFFWYKNIEPFAIGFGSTEVLNCFVLVYTRELGIEQQKFSGWKIVSKKVWNSWLFSLHPLKLKWQLAKKAPQTFFMHFALMKRACKEEIQEKQEQVREWLQNLGIGEHTTVMQDDEEVIDEPVLVRNEESFKNRDVPSSAALPIIRPALGRQHSMPDRARLFE